MMLKHNRHDDRVVKSALLCLWILSSVLGTMVNKRLMKSLSFPMTLTIFHLFTAFACDIVAISRRQSLFELYRNITTLELIGRAIIVGAFSAISKALTLFSYGKLSLSLAHTLKSSSPIFAATLSFLLFRSRLSMPQIGALCTISFGVALSSFTEMHCEFTGLLAALLSCLIGVCQSMIVKDTISSLHCDPFIFHLLNTTAAMIVMIPPAMLYELSALMNFIPEKVDASQVLDVSHRNSLILLSLLCQYGATIGSLLALSKLPVLAHQVANVGKRLSIIIISIITFGNSVTFINVVGMTIAMLGFAWFVFVKKPSQPPTSSLFETHLVQFLKTSVRRFTRAPAYLPISQTDGR